MAPGVDQQAAPQTPWGEKVLHAFVVLILVAVILCLGAMVYQEISSAVDRAISPYVDGRELDKNRTKWQSQPITHYSMVVDLPYGSGYYERLPLTVEVKDEKVVSAVDALGHSFDPGTDPDFQYYYPDAFTIPDLFSFAYSTIWSRPPSISVSYDPDLGYPTDIEIDPLVGPCCQWEFYSVRNFQELP